MFWGLLGNKDKNIEIVSSPLRCIRLAIDECGVIGIFLSTSSQIEQLENENLLDK
jgi:hypothetical protein